jgi:hypothetical protein
MDWLASTCHFASKWRGHHRPARRHELVGAEGPWCGLVLTSLRLVASEQWLQPPGFQHRSTHPLMILEPSFETSDPAQFELVVFKFDTSVVFGCLAQADVLVADRPHHYV